MIELAKSHLILSILYLIIVGRSRDSPNPITLTPSGSPIGSNISGRNIPSVGNRFGLFFKYF